MILSLFEDPYHLSILWSIVSEEMFETTNLTDTMANEKITYKNILKKKYSKSKTTVEGAIIQNKLA